MAVNDLAGFLRGLTRRMAATALADQTDGQLVDKVLVRQDEAALEAIVQRHGAMVYRVCWRVLRNDQDAEDAFQATFLVLARKLRDLRKRASVASWLHGVAYRVAQKARVAASTRRRHESQAQVSTQHGGAGAESLVVLDAELEQLPEKWRLPLILCYLEGKTQDEAARHLGWSKSTLRSRLDEARTALARRLTRRGIVWPAALGAVLVSDCLATAAPAGLVANVMAAAANVLAGKTIAAVASAKVAALTEGVLKMMFLTKLKPLVLGLFLLGIAGFGAGLLSHDSGAPLLRAESNNEEAAPRGSDRRDKFFAVSSDVPGRIADVLVEEGDSVRAGDILIRLDDRSAKLQLKSANVKVASAEAELTASRATANEAKENSDKTVNLRKAKVVSEYDSRIAFLTWVRHQEESVQKEGAVKTARIEVEKAQLELDKHVLRSPSDGIVLTVHFIEGEAIRERTTLMRIRVRHPKSTK